MDPLESVDPAHDTTYVLMLEALARGHAVYHVAPADVTRESRGVVLRGRKIGIGPEATFPFRVERPFSLTCEDLDAVLIRTDPPVDADYLAVTWLLDLLPPRVFVMNRPSGLRDANEKLAALAFPDLSPATCIDQNPGRLEEFRRSVGGSVALKPLDGHGGTGVLLAREGDPNLRALMMAATRGGSAKVVAQEVVAGAEAGDTRIILLDGEPLGAMLRRHDGGSFVHNLAAGGRAFPAALTDRDRALCSRIGPWLRDRGLWLAGVDLVGGKLIEINVTSPTCVQEINRFDGVRLERAIVDFVEARAGG